MANILFAMPIAGDLHPLLYERCINQISNIVKTNPEHRIDVGIFNDSDSGGSKSSGYCQNRYAKIAQARNNTLEKYLKPHHEYVFWCDADVSLPNPKLPSILLQYNKYGVLAPISLYDAHFPQWYDRAGFVQIDKWANAFPPYFDYSQGVSYPLLNLNSVGLCYIIPAEVYQHQKYEITEGFTEHYKVCQKAKDLGYSVQVLLTEKAVHAFIEEYSSRTVGYPNGTQQIFYFQNGITHNHWQYTDEPETLQWVIDNVSKEDMFVDIGCNIGIITTLAAQKTKHIIGIDANPHVIEFAQCSNPNIPYYNAIIGNVDSSVIAFAGLAGLSKKPAGIPDMSIPYILQTFNPTIIKIDVDGYDSAIVEELLRWGYKGKIIVEVEDLALQRFGASAKQLLNLINPYIVAILDKYNYVCEIQ